MSYNIYDQAAALPPQRVTVGTDLVSIQRFVSWSQYSRIQLLRIFSPFELEAAKLTPGSSDKEHKGAGQSGNRSAEQAQQLPLERESNAPVLYSAEKLATRFAAKEAFYKAWTSYISPLSPKHHPPALFSFCRHVCVTTARWGVPALDIEWQAVLALSELPHEQMGYKYFIPDVQLSLTHEREYASATVLCVQRYDGYQFLDSLLKNLKRDDDFAA